MTMTDKTKKLLERHQYKDKSDLALVVLALAEAGVPPDLQELLISGDAQRGIEPGALTSICIALFEQYNQWDRVKLQQDHDRAVEERDEGIDLLVEVARYLKHDEGCEATASLDDTCTCGLSTLDVDVVGYLSQFKNKTEDNDAD